MNLTLATSTLKKTIMEQSQLYDGELGSIKSPEGRLLFAVIGQAITDLLGYAKAKPGASNYQSRIALADNAKAFFFSPGLNDFTDHLGLDAAWIRKKIKIFLGLLDKHKTEGKRSTAGVKRRKKRKASR